MAEPDGERGGSFCLEPVFLVPGGALDRAYHPALGYGADFDIPVTPRWSVLFGVNTTELRSRQNPDLYLDLIPAWMGVKVKHQWLPYVEYYGEIMLQCVYERLYYRDSGQGAQENVDASAVVGAGYDWWLNRWLLVGLMSRCSFVVEQDRVFPYTQIGLRLGMRQ